MGMSKASWGRLIACVAIAVVVSVSKAGGKNEMPRVVAPDPDRLVTGVLHRVIDGDSIELFVDGGIVAYELAGADAPDLVEDESRVIWGSVAARDHLVTMLVGEQVAVLLDRTRPKDAMGRSRGYVYRMPDGLFVNLEMVRLGFSKHARDPSGFNNEVMLWAQQRARDARKGVWAPQPAPVPIPVSVPVVGTEPSAEESAAPNGETKVEPESTAGGEESSAAESGVVYITKSGTKYHTKDCPHARNTGVARPRDAVRKTHGACKSCDPDGNAVASADD